MESRQQLPAVQDDALPAPSAPSSQLDACSQLDQRIGVAPVKDLPALVRARGAIIQQDEWRKEVAHGRWAQTALFYAKVVFSIMAGIAGVTLTVLGFTLTGLFLLGGMATIYVPDYVKQALDKFKSDGGDAA